MTILNVKFIKYIYIDLIIVVKKCFEKVVIFLKNYFSLYVNIIKVGSI